MPRAQAGESLPSSSWRVAGSPVTRVADVYEVVGLIATREIGTVYRVRHLQGMDFALRVPNLQLIAIRGAARQFIARAEQWLALGPHPNIASCYQLHSVNGLPMVLAELVDGPSLRSWQPESPGDGLRQGLDLALQLCGALAYAHSRGIAHGACTPENIRIAHTGEAKLLDFGCSLSGVAVANPEPSTDGDAGEAFALAALMRAAPYVAPERWQQPTVIAPSADVFALAVCLWELFGGVRPYDSTGTATPQRASDLSLGRDDAHGELARLLQRCVAWDATERPTRIDDVGRELSRIYERLFGAAPKDRSAELSAADRLNAAAVHALYSGRFSDAENGWKAALKSDPGHLDSVFNRIVAQWRQGMITDEAVAEQVDALVAQRAAPGTVPRLHGVTHFERGDLASAEVWLEQAAHEQPAARSPAVLQELERVRLLRQKIEPTALAIERGGAVSALDVSADGKTALAASETGAAVWDVARGACVQALQGHDGGVSAAVLSADGRAALTGGNDGTIRVWEIGTGVCQRVLAPGAGQITSLSVNADGALLLWSARSDLTIGSTIQLWDTGTGRPVQAFERQAAPIRCAVLSVDGRYAVSGGDDHLIHLWDVKSGNSRTISGHEHLVAGVCVSPDSELILSASWDKTLRLWNRRTARCLRVFTGHRTSATAVCLSADMVWAASGDLDGTIRLWEVMTGRCLRTLAGHGGPVTAVAISATGDRVISGSLDGTVRAWNTSPELREPYRLRVA